MARPFSLMDKMREQPYAIGEANRYVPLIPLMSGEEAMNSLTSYYPRRGMDSKLSPFTFTREARARSPIKIAKMLAAASQIKTAAGQSWVGKQWADTKRIFRGAKNTAAGSLGGVLGVAAQYGGATTDAMGLTKNLASAGAPILAQARQSMEAGAVDMAAGFTGQLPSEFAKQHPLRVGGRTPITADQLARQRVTYLQNAHMPNAAGTVSFLNRLSDDTTEMLPAAAAGQIAAPLAATKYLKHLKPAADTVLSMQAFSGTPGELLAGGGNPANTPAFQQGAIPLKSQDGPAYRDPETQEMMIRLYDGTVMPEPPQVREFAQTPDGKAAIEHVAKTGQTSPQVDQAASKSLFSAGLSPEVVMQKLRGMDGWAKLGLASGLGLSTVGAIMAANSDDKEEGGSGMLPGLFMAAAGLGVGGYSAYKGGLLGGAKTASLHTRGRTNYANKLVAAIDPAKSGLVTGFMRKCAAAALPAVDILGVIAQACQYHPAIAHEFARCGFIKTAFSSGGGIPNMYDSHPLRHLDMQPPTPVRSPPLQPITGTQPNRTSLMEQRAPGGPGVATPIKGAPAVGTQNFGENTRLFSPRGPSPFPFPSPSQSKPPGSAQVSGAKLPVPPAPVPQDGGGMTESIMRQMAGMSPAAKIALAAGLGLTGYGAYRMLSPDDEEEQRLKTAVAPLSPTVAPTPQQYTPPKVTGLLPPAGPLDKPPAPAATQAPASPVSQPPATAPAVTADRAKMQAPTPAPAPAPTPATAQASVQAPVQAPAPATAPAQAQAQAQAPAQAPAPGAIPQSQDGKLATADWLETMLPAEYSQIATLVSQAPDKAKALAGKAVAPVTAFFGTPEGKMAADAVNKTGQLPPGAKAKAEQQLGAEGFDKDSIFGFLNNMNGWEQFGLAAGLGVTAIGLINMISGEGGMGSWIMTALGIGGAAYAGASSGMFGAGAQNMTKDVNRGFGDLAVGGSDALGMSKSKPIDPVAKKMLSGAMQHAPDAGITKILEGIKQNYPDLAGKLNQASGHGSWGNSALSFLGDVTGKRQQMMTDQLGLQPAQQDRLLKLWSQLHQQKKPGKI